jgi:hypothetical protein
MDFPPMDHAPMESAVIFPRVLPATRVSPATRMSMATRLLATRLLATGLLLAGLTGIMAAAPGPALAEDLQITHVTSDQFPVLKTKVFNSNFGLYGAAGNAVMRSRYGADNAANGDRVFVYGYQLDLAAAYNVIGTPGVTAVTLDLPKMPDLATTPKLPAGAKFYVITEEGGANKAIDLQSASSDGTKITFTFATPVRPGKTSGTGDHSLWFGLVTSTVAKRGDVLLSTLAEAKAASQIPVNPQPSPQTAASQNQSGNATSIAQPTPVDPTATPPLNVFLPIADTAVVK